MAPLKQTSLLARDASEGRSRLSRSFESATCASYQRPEKQTGGRNHLIDLLYPSSNPNAFKVG